MNCTGAFVHIAIKRSLGYYHHILVKNWKEAKKTIFEYSITFHNLFNHGEVTEKELNEKEIREKELEKNIRDGNVYIIDAPNYPRNYNEILEALERLLNRLKEKAYAVAYNNCEHLINYVLTGTSKSEQVNNANAIKKFVIDSFDNCFINGESNLKKIWQSLKYCIPVQCVIEVTKQAVINEAKKSAIRMGASIINETCMSVASKIALTSTALTTFLVTGVVEVFYTKSELSELKRQKEDQIITENDYNREWYKRVSGSVGATVGATVGSVGFGVLGQTLCPIPVLGYAIGNAVGNFVGRWLTSAFAGYCFDRSKLVQ